MWSRAELKYRAKNILKCNYWIFVFAGFIMSFINDKNRISFKNSSTDVEDIISNIDTKSVSNLINSLSDGIGLIVNSLLEKPALFIGGMTIAVMVVLLVTIARLAFSVFIINPIITGGYRFFNRSLVMNTPINEFLFAFKASYLNIVKIMFLKKLYTFLWSLLFIVPGIIKSYEYYLVPYIIGDNPDIEAEEAFRISRELMYGNKMDTFILDLSFIGWYILSSITFGLLNIFYVTPYVYLTRAALYRKLSDSDNIRYNRNYTTYGNSGSYGGI